jgi:NAD kinase
MQPDVVFACSHAKTATDIPQTLIANAQMLSMTQPSAQPLQLACIADKSDKAQEAYAQLCARYDFVDLKANKKQRPDAIIVLGGDGFMLQLMHQQLHRSIPLYGMNCGTVGFFAQSFCRR